MSNLNGLKLEIPGNGSAIDKVRKHYAPSKLTIEIIHEDFYRNYAWMDFYHIQLTIPHYPLRNDLTKHYKIASANGHQLKDVFDEIENGCSEFIKKYPTLEAWRQNGV